VDKVTLSIDLVNAMLGCLGKMPFIEVQGIINAVQLEANAQFTQDVSTDSIDALTTDSVAALSTDQAAALSTEQV
jgi:ALTTAQ repeat